MTTYAEHRKRHIRRSFGDQVINVITYIVYAFFAFVCVFPFYYLIINSISAFKVFNELFPLFSGPGVGKNLYTMVYYIYDQFRGRTPPKYGYAAAAAIILFLIIFAFTQIQQLIQKKWKY